MSLLLAGFIAAPAALAAVGRTPGEFSVDANGAATYTIPINVAPGINGLQPGIALVYDSQAGDGPLGMRWTLAGFSSISRCDTTVATNGAARGISFDGDDQFCLDGQPLVRDAANLAPFYGASGTLYRTEVDRYVRVTSYGATNGGPTYFAVQQPNGMTSYYGETTDLNTSNSRVPATGLTSPRTRTWKLSQIQDKFFNSIRFTYKNSTGDFNPAEVSWTDYCNTLGCTSGSGARYKISFVYETRSPADKRSGYLAGSTWSRNTRLQKITYQLDSVTVQDYTLGYTTPPSTGTQRSQLASVTQCGATSSDCFTATSFQWQNGVAGWNTTQTAVSALDNTGGGLYGDFDGDGRTDIASQWISGHVDTWTILRANGYSFTKLYTTTDAHGGRVGDFNGDGRDDLIGVDDSSPSKWVIQISNVSSAGAAFDTVQTNIESSTMSSPTVLDYNGDGLPDLVYVRDNSVYMRKNTGGAFAAEIPAVGFVTDYLPVGFSFPPPKGSPNSADFDGDGRADLFIHYHSDTIDRWFAYVYTGSASDESSWALFGSTPIEAHVVNALVMDINGDGLSDLVYNQDNTAANSIPGSSTMLSNGTRLGEGFTPPQAIAGTWAWSYPPDAGTRFEVVVDYDGDGRDDLLIGPGKVYLSNGTSLSYALQLYGVFGYTAGYPVVAIDANGDGALDLLFGRQDGLNCPCNHPWYLVTHNQPLGNLVPAGDLVTSITDGLQNTISQITYKPLTDTGTGGVYTATTGSYTPTPALPVLYNHLVRGSSLPVVSQYTTNDGIGGTYDLKFHYTNLWQNNQGRGPLGFRRVEQTGGPTGALQTSMVYRQDFPYTGRLVEQAVCRQTQPATDCSVTATTRVTTVAHQWTKLSPASYFGTDPPYQDVRELTTQSKEYDAAGAALRTTTRDLSGATDWNYTLGVPNKEVTTVQPGGGGSSWTMTRDYTYGNSTVAAAWCLGLPTRVDETRQNPDASQATRTVTFEYFNHCKLYAQNVGPPGTVKTLRTWFDYNAYGNVAYRSEMDAVQQSVIRHTDYVYNADQYRVLRETRVVAAGTSTTQTNQCGGTTVTTTPQSDLQTEFTWDYRLGLQSSERTPQGVLMTRSFDAFGRPIAEEQVTRGALHTNIGYYMCNGDCFPAHSAYKVIANRSDGASSTAFFDAYGRQVGESKKLLDGTESRQATRFNALGQVSERDVPYIAGAPAGFVSYDHDAIGRFTKETRPTGQNVSTSGATETNYSYAGLTTTVTDPEGRTRALESNADGTLKEVREGPAGSLATTSYEYTAFGEVNKITDAGNQAGTRAVSTFGYDGRGFLTARSDADRGSWTFDYNAWGDLILQIQPNGRQDFTYDPVGRLVSRTDKTANPTTLELTTSWSYYGNNGGQTGQLHMVTTGAYHRQAFTYYDSGSVLGLPQQTKTMFLETTLPAYDTDYSYDSLGRLQTVTYPMTAVGRFQARYSYVNGYLQKVCQGSGASCINDLYTVGDATGSQQSPMDALGRITRAYFGASNSGTRETYSFDPANLRLSAIQTTGSATQNYTYQWDRNGNLTQRTQPNAQENFTYDPLNRLDVASLTAGGSTTPTLDMAYDPNGNITSKVTGGAGGGTGLYSYATTGGGPHAVSNISGNNGGTFRYDTAGNLTCRSWSGTACNAGSTTLWYSFNLPKRIEYSSTDTYADFSYGPNRERVRTTEHEGSAERVIYHVGPHFEVETSTAYTGTHYRSTVFFGERAVYARVDGPSLLEEGYLHQDHQGSVDKVTNIYGIPATTKISLSFDAFGKRRDPGSWANDNTDALFAETQWLERGYTGHQQLDGVRLIHMNGRVQNPTWGRMLSPDPVVGDLTRPQSLNAYSYVMNNPLSFTDPTGFDLQEVVVTASCSCIRVQRDIQDFVSRFSDDQILQSIRTSFEQRMARLMPYVDALWRARSAVANGKPVSPADAALLGSLRAANEKFRNNTDPNTTVLIDASTLTVTQTGPFGPSGTAPGVVQGLEWLVYGSVTLQSDANGNISLLRDVYNFEQHDVSLNDPHWFREVVRNFGTYGGFYVATYGGLSEYWADVTGGNHATGFRLQFYGTPNVVRGDW